jgi:hypothetical protein
MKLNFTKKEYQALVEMLLAADWVITGHEEEEEREETKPYRELRKKVLAHFKEMGPCPAPGITRRRTWDAWHRAAMRRASSAGTVSSPRPCTSRTGQVIRHPVWIGAMASRQCPISPST